MKALLFLLTAASLTVAAPVPKELRAKRPDYRPMAVGDKREYANPADPKTVTEVREITRVEVDGKVRRYTQTFSATSGTMVLTVDANGVVGLAEQNGRESPGVHKIVAPNMKEGDSWPCNDAIGRVRTVGKAERVAVPAGTFTAVPVTVSYPAGQALPTVVSWYADGVGLVRQDSGGRPALVLVKYTPGKEKK